MTSRALFVPLPNVYVVVPAAMTLTLSRRPDPE